MATLAITTGGTTTTTTTCRRIAAAILVIVSFFAIVVHGKTSRGPKPIIVETSESIRFADRPVFH
jgi:hypothetical protein